MEEEHWVSTQLDGLRRTKKRAVAGRVDDVFH